MINFTILNKLQIVLGFFHDPSFGFAEQFTSMVVSLFEVLYLLFFENILNCTENNDELCWSQFAISLR